jgi:hypothetical protein
MMSPSELLLVEYLLEFLRKQSWFEELGKTRGTGCLRRLLPVIGETGTEPLHHNGKKTVRGGGFSFSQI